jgi:hypothetical protein
LTVSRFDQAKDDCDYRDEEPLLNLSILNAPIQRMIAESVAASPDGRLAPRNQEGRIEEHLNGRGEIASELVIVDPDMINAHLNMQEDEEDDAELYPRQPSPFLRMVRRSIDQLHKNNLYLNSGRDGA